MIPVKLLKSDYDERRSQSEDDLIEEASSAMRKPLETGEGQKSLDNEQLVSFLNGVEANPYLDAFYAVLSQVLDTPYQKTFFNVLQHLREIHLLRRPSGIEYVWEALEKFACRLKHLRSPSEAQELLIRLTYECGDRVNGVISAETMISSSDCLGCCCSCHRDPTSSNCTTPSGRPPSPPPLPPPQTPCVDRKRKPADGQTSGPNSGASTDSCRPTFAEMISNAASSASLKSSETPVARRSPESLNRLPAETSPSLAMPLRTPPPPPAPSVLDDSVVIGAKLLPQQNLPQPKTKLKTFPWSKVPASKIIENVNNGDNVWIKVASRFDTGAITSAINFDDLETLFAAQTSSPPNTIERHRGGERSHSGPLTPNAANRLSGGDYHLSSNGIDGSSTLGRRRDASSDINLLDPKRSLNVNIFLKQFRGGIDDLIELIETGDSHYLGLEKLRGLAKILPAPDELDALKAYAGDKCKLGNGERFFLALINISNYRLRVESMLLKEEFLSMVEYMKPSVNTLIAAARDLKNSQSLQEVLFLLLLVGNYLNAGGYGGNAAGFKMTSLWKLVEIRANKPNVTLLHYVVAEIEKKNPRLLDLPKELKHLDDASKLAFDTVLSDFRHLKEKTERVSKEVAQIDADDEIRNQTEVFFEFAKGELITIERDIAQVDRLRLDLAAFFCEDAHTFKLEECFKIFATFCQRFGRAIDENAERRLKEEKAELRRRLREQQQAKKEIAITRRISFSEDCSRRLSDKYKSLLNTGDVLLPYHRSNSPNGTVDSRKSNMHTNLVDVLTATSSANSGSASQNPRRSSGGDDEPCNEAEFSPGSAFWRRSYNCKRRGVPSVTSSTFTNRERPRDLDAQQTKPWRQRFEELLVESERPNGRTTHSASSIELDSLCYPRQPGQQDFSPSSVTAANVDKPVEYSPIFAKTFPRRENIRIASVSDLDQYRTSSTASVNQDPQPRAPPLEMKRSIWREHRRLRANSLLTDVGEVGAASANDLNELLEILKIENGSNAAIRRRVSKLQLVTSESSDEASENQKTPPVLSPMPEKTAKTDIDEVVRHCEQAREEIDSMGEPVTTTILALSHSNSPIFEEPDTIDQSSHFEECSADFSLSASNLPDCTSCNLVISCGGDIRSCASGSHDSVDVVGRCSESVSVVVMPAPSAPLCEMLDEGFEEDASNSTNCSSVAGVPSPPLLPASTKLRSSQQQQRREPPTSSVHAKSTPKSRPVQSVPKSVSTTASQTKFSYQSGTKSSAMKVAQNSAAKKTETRPSSAFFGRSSVSGSMEGVHHSRSSVASNSSRSGPIPNAPRNDRTPTSACHSRRSVSNTVQSKPSSRPEGRRPVASRVTPAILAPTTCSAAKARIQVVPPTRPSVQRQRTTASSSSCSSGSEPEQHGPKCTPFRKRMPLAAVSKSAHVKDQAPVRKITPTKEKQNQPASVLAAAPRASVSSFRPFSVRKNNAAPVA